MTGVPTTTAIDRIAPTQRPGVPRNHGTQIWTDLLFMHWWVEAEAMRRVVPPELELDLWDGRALVGIVPFQMSGVRTWWMPRRFGLRFLETNLRTYVVHQGRPGVYFFSLEAASMLAVRVARWQWSLPYWDARMRCEIDGTSRRYTSQRTGPRGFVAAELDVRYSIGAPINPAPGTLEYFLLERYLLFALRGGHVWTGHVHHVPYPAHLANVVEVRESLVSAIGLPATDRPPDLAHASPGVEVEVFGPWRLDLEPPYLRALAHPSA